MIRPTIRGMPDDEQTPEELAAHYGPQGPVAAASSWLEAVALEGDYAKAWTMMTPTLRLARSQAWLWNNREEFEQASESLDEQAAMLAAEPSTHPEWHSFAELELEQMQEVWPAEDYAKVGIASRPRPLGPNLEVVLFAMMDDPGILSVSSGVSGDVLQVDWPGRAVEITPYAVLIVEHVEGRWLVAGHNHETIPVPGWPPVL